MYDFGRESGKGGFVYWLYCLIVISLALCSSDCNGFPRFTWEHFTVCPAANECFSPLELDTYIEIYRCHIKELRISCSACVDLRAAGRRRAGMM